MYAACEGLSDLGTRLPEILHADISTISTFRGLKGDFHVGSRVCMSEVSNSMPCLRAEMSCMRDSWIGRTGSRYRK